MAKRKIDMLDANLDESMGVGVPAMNLLKATSDESARHEDTRRTKTTFDIAVEKIRNDPQQPRKIFDEERLRQLAESLKRQGQLQSITVRWVESLQKYVVISGERRLRAARIAGLTTLRCEVREDGREQEEILEDQLVENLLRDDLSPMEQARGFKLLIDKNGWTYRDIRDKLNVSLGLIANAMSLLDLDPSVQQKLQDGLIPASVGHELAKIEDKKEQAAVAEIVVDKGLKASDISSSLRMPTGRMKRSMKSSDGITITVSGPAGVTPEQVRAAFHEYENRFLINDSQIDAA